MKWLNRNDFELLLLGASFNVLHCKCNGTEHMDLISFYIPKRKSFACLKTFKPLWSSQAWRRILVLQRECYYKSRNTDFGPKNKVSYHMAAWSSIYDEHRPFCRNQLILRKSTGMVYSLVCPDTKKRKTKLTRCWDLLASLSVWCPQWGGIQHTTLITMDPTDAQKSRMELIKVLWKIIVELTYISWLLKCLSQESTRQIWFYFLRRCWRILFLTSKV